MSVNVENVKKWVDALRSGKYEQGYGALRGRDGVGFCCLAVACDVSGVGEWRHGDDGRLRFWTDEDYGRGTDLPPAVLAWLGLSIARDVDDGNPYVVLGDGRTKRR